MENSFENLLISSTKKSPKISLNKDTGEIEMRGMSIPENSKEFYGPIIAWIENYVANPCPKTTVTLAMQYINSSTTMIFNKILKKLDAEIKAPNSIRFIWYFEEDDIEMKDVGGYYAELLSNQLDIIEVEEI